MWHGMPCLRAIAKVYKQCPTKLKQILTGGFMNALIDIWLACQQSLCFGCQEQHRIIAVKEEASSSHGNKPTPNKPTPNM